MLRKILLTLLVFISFSFHATEAIDNFKLDPLPVTLPCAPIKTMYSNVIKPNKLIRIFRTQLSPDDTNLVTELWVFANLNKENPYWEAFMFIEIQPSMFIMCIIGDGTEYTFESTQI